MKRAAVTWLLGGTVAVFLLVMFVVLANGAAPDAAAATSCSSTGGTDVDVATLDADQSHNASVIVQVGEGKGVGAQGEVIAIATAMQESGLRNLDYGDRDSLGLFQQRPSQGWGTAAQIMDPVYSAGIFYDRLVKVDGWQSMPVWQAAQSVQRSAFPQAYAKHVPAAVKIVETVTGGAAGAVILTSADCGPGGAGAPWGTAVSNDVPVNPRSPAEAIAWAEGQAAAGTTGWKNRCLNFVAQTYGYAASNDPAPSYAVDHFLQVVPVQLRHADRNPPPGALLFWRTGNPAGHVALYLGNGMIASTDIARPGQVDVVPASEIETKWHGTYLGWTPPLFPYAG